MTLLEQLGDLVLRSVPTMILFLITLGAYVSLVHIPLRKTLRERTARTQGVIERANATIAIAEAKTADYEKRLRNARAAVFQDRHGRLRQVREDSELALADVRTVAQERLADALMEIEKSAAAARLQLENSIDGLAAGAMRAVLPAGSVPVREARTQEQAG